MTVATDSDSPSAPQPATGRGSPLEVLFAFLRLGTTSFGGPVAHLGYFRAEFVERRRWLDDHSYSDLVALCQFLPGPASSQVGMGLGLWRAGWPGLVAAWMGFTLPSAALLIVFAYGITHFAGLAQSGAVHGLKLAAVAVVAQAVWGMARTLCPDRTRAAMAIASALLVLSMPSAAGQLVAIAACALVGWRVLPTAGEPVHVPAAYHVSRVTGAVAFVLFVGLLLLLPAVAAAAGTLGWQLVDGFYRAGALVFGGGHVVLPLLQASVVPSGAVGNQQFLAGYGAAQAVPGPLFTFAAYLGAVADLGVARWLGGLAMLAVIFLPALLILVAALPFWEALRRRPGVRTAIAGVNASVVGLLLAALYDPVWTSAIHGRKDFAVALAAFGLLAYARWSPLLVVLLSAAVGWLLFGASMA
jgi:chromate transporter